jgi:hypothetical protein
MCRPPTVRGNSNPAERAMTDILMILLGCGGIAGMIAYAWLCERV